MANQFPNSDYVNSLSYQSQRNLLANLINKYNEQVPRGQQVPTYNPNTPDYFRPEFSLYGLFGGSPYQESINEIANNLFTIRGLEYPNYLEEY